MLSDFELGWLAGILEGEGCFDLSTNRTPRVRVSMTDEDIVLRVSILFTRITGCYHQVFVHTPKGQGERRKAHQQAYTVAAYGSNAVKVIKKTVKYMGARRRQRMWQTVNRYKPKNIALDKATTSTLMEAMKADVVQLRRRV